MDHSISADELWWGADDARQPKDDSLLIQCSSFDISSEEVSLGFDQIARRLTLDPALALSKSRLAPAGVA